MLLNKSLSFRPWLSSVLDALFEQGTGWLDYEPAYSDIVGRRMLFKRHCGQRMRRLTHTYTDTATGVRRRQGKEAYCEKCRFLTDSKDVM